MLNLFFIHNRNGRVRDKVTDSGQLACARAIATGEKGRAEWLTSGQRAYLTEACFFKLLGGAFVKVTYIRDNPKIDTFWRPACALAGGGVDS